MLVLVILQADIFTYFCFQFETSHYPWCCYNYFLVSWFLVEAGTGEATSICMLCKLGHAIIFVNVKKMGRFIVHFKPLT